MANNIQKIIIGMALIIMLHISAWALDPPHNEVNTIGCGDCHAMHKQGGMMGGAVIVRDGEQEALCKTCHNSTGPASSMTEVANHMVNNGMTHVDCGSCHDPHAPEITEDEHVSCTPLPDCRENNNLKLIRKNTSIYRSGALTEAVFHTKPDHFTFTETPYNGICQACHTDTAHHRNDGTDPHHQEATVCTTCHLHKDGFKPGGCTECHDTAQDNGDGVPVGGRRQIVTAGGDFDMASHHVNGTIEDDDCRTCHYINNHGSGTVKLKDPDAGNAVVYDFNSAAPEELENFCLNCHDADGASDGNGTTPFSDLEIVPNIEAGGLWASSTHSTGGVTNSGYTCFGDGATTGCHGSGHGSNLKKLLAPIDGTAGTDNFNEEEGFCYNCHGNSNVINEAVSNGWFGGVYQDFTSDIQTAFSMPSNHPVTDSDPRHTFDLGDGNGPQELECTSCHNVHQGTGKYWDSPAGLTSMILPSTGELWGDDADEKIGQFEPSLLYQAPFIGEPGLDLSGQPLPIDGAGNSLLIGTAQPDYNTVCLECHQYNVGGVVAINMTLKHMSAPAEPADSVIGWPMELPFADASRGQYFLSCSDCHEPHGSDNTMLIKRTANNGIVTDLTVTNNNKDWIGFCDQCHESDPQARHHNDDVWYNKLGYDPNNPWGSCTTVCHPMGSDGLYKNCVTSGCHGHNDFF